VLGERTQTLSSKRKCINVATKTRKKERKEERHALLKRRGNCCGEKRTVNLTHKRKKRVRRSNGKRVEKKVKLPPPILRTENQSKKGEPRRWKTRVWGNLKRVEWKNLWPKVNQKSSGFAIALGGGKRGERNPSSGPVKKRKL